MLKEKLKRFYALLLESYDLFTTFDRASAGFKVYGRPHYSGGPRTKIAQLAEVAARKGQPYSRIVCLSAVRVPLVILRLLKWQGAHVLVNQNGVAYPLWYPDDYKRQNSYFRHLNRIANEVHFQSEFARRSFETWVDIPNPSHSIVYNGVDLSVFFPRPHQMDTKEGRFVVAVFVDLKKWNRTLWEKVLDLIEAAQSQGRLKNVQWKFIGKIHDPSIEAMIRSRLEHLATSDFVDLVLDIPQGRVPEILSQAQVLLHLVYNDVCPNKVLEAMACGVPVIGVSAGGTSELIGDAGVVLQVPGGYEQEHFPENSAMIYAIEEVQRTFVELRERVLARAGKFSLKQWLERSRGEV